VAAVALVLAACGAHPFVAPTTTQVASQSHTPLATSGAVTITRHPALGVDLYAPRDLSVATIEGKDAQLLKITKRELGINSVGIVWNLYTPNRHSNVVEASGGSLSAKDVILLTRMAEKDGLSVEYRPIIRVGPSAGWEGDISPESLSKWFTSLYNVELPYLRVARQLHVREFVVQTELVHLNTQSGYWTSYFARVRRQCPHTIISAAAAAQSYFPKLGLRPVLVPSRSYRYFGFDAYMPLKKLPASAPLAEVVKRWEGWFATVKTSVRERTTIQETGIPAARGAYSFPANWNKWQSPKLRDVTVQARWIKAACISVEHFHMRGVYFYNVNLTDGIPWPTSNVTFMGKKASVAAIKSCLSIFHEKPSS
jgi:hypothetical protein